MADAPLVEKEKADANGSGAPEAATTGDGEPVILKHPSRERIKRQTSTDSKGRIRTVSSGGSLQNQGRARSASISSYSRRPSLSFSHADSIPFDIGKPSPEEVDPENGWYYIIHLGLK